VNDDHVLARDFDQLEKGDVFATGGRTVTESDLVSFAGLTGDWHPQHVDAAWAAGSEFGERIAHGMLVLSFAVGLVPIDPDRVAALRGIDDVTFKRPVKIGDTIHVEGRVEDLRPLTGEVGLVTCLWKVINQSDEVAVRARVAIVWRRPGGAPPTNGSANQGSERLFEEVYL
jgi:3-hydroxybutyryl-CoA dehydratase